MTGRIAALIPFLAAPAGCGGSSAPAPPGQTWTDRFPVYSIYGEIESSREDWTLSIGGLVEVDTVLDWEAFTALGPVSDTLDFHCVTGWSRRGDVWTGIPSAAILSLVRPLPEAVSVMVSCADGYSTNVPLGDFGMDGVMLAFELDGQPLTPSHGFPVRLLVPHLYAYKAAKWVTGLEFLPEDIPGYWESRGYHPRGDPWTEQRFQ